VYYGFPDDHGLEADSTPSYSDRTTGFFSFRGMTIVYFCSRFLLSFQYLLLYFYARRKNYPAQNQFLLQIGGLLLSACMWIGSFFLEGEDVSDAMRIAKFGLWYGGIGVEILSTVLIWLCCRVTGFRRTHLTERFATLTLLILGEGVIGYAIALQASMFLYDIANIVIGGVGFGPPAGLAVVMVCLTIYLLWVFYFSRFLETAEYNVLHAYAWVTPSVTV
jgi:low temperature requirement protein LtrA